MSSHANPNGEEHLAVQFEGRAQQDESYLVGMWAFLATEVMFFGALFVCYAVYRMRAPQVFVAGHHFLSVPMGTINTAILLTSSLTMACAVHFAQRGRKSPQIILMMVTMFLAICFLGIKGVEYSAKFREHLVPGIHFVWEPGNLPGSSSSTSNEPPVTRDQAQMFFSLYFALTGLHALHIIIGVFIMGTLTLMLMGNHSATRYFMPVEMTGLYWHFVDIVWIFLYPLLYLIPS